MGGRAYLDWDAADREKVLKGLLDPSVPAGLYDELRGRLRHVQRWIALGKSEESAAKRVHGTERERREDAARGHYRRAERLIGEVSYGLATESVGSALTRRIRLPLDLAPADQTLQAQLALALLEELTGARQSGQCPYCLTWWTAPDLRKRRTCGRDQCDAQRKAEWRKSNPEPAQQVRARVERHRKRRRRAERRKGGRA